MKGREINKTNRSRTANSTTAATKAAQHQTSDFTEKKEGSNADTASMAAINKGSSARRANTAAALCKNLILSK